MRAQHVPWLALMAGVGVALTVLAPAAWLVILQEGLLVLVLLGAAAGTGAWPCVLLGQGGRPALQQCCLSIALGLGLLAILTLVLGVAGLLSQTVTWVLLGLGIAAGIARLQTRRGADTDTGAAEEAPAARALGGVLLLTLAYPLGVMLFCATLPPGVLWSFEAQGYDALEYHLQAPREYYDAGRIHFLLHNVYAQFPQQMESLYLLLMYLAGGPYEGAIPAQLLHASCGILALVALAAWSPPGWPRRTAVLAGGAVVWLITLGALAYVELGMLFFAAVAAGLLLDELRAAERPGWRTAVTAGLCAGLAGGCKYTALVFVPTALGLAWVLTLRGSLARRAQYLLVFGLAALAAFSPWLIRNAAFTGNPVYPFAYAWFGGAAWSEEQAVQWERGHRVAEERSSVAGRVGIVVDELLTSSMYGPLLFVLGLAGIGLGRTRLAVMPALWLALVVTGWAVLTHMPGRFAMPAIIPLAYLAGMAAGSPRRARSPRQAIVTMLVVVAALYNSYTIAGLLAEHERWWARWGVPLRQLPGMTAGWVAAHPLRERIPADGRVWLVGDARAFYLPSSVRYTVVFNRDPWLEAVRDATPAAAVEWLRTQNVTHVVFSWDEIRRLRGSYGFADWVTPAWAAALASAGLERVTPPAEAATSGYEVFEVQPR